MWGGCLTWGHLGLGPRCGFWPRSQPWAGLHPRAARTIHVPLSPTILHVAPTTWREKNYVIFELKLLALQSVNFKSDDRFVVPGPNGRGSFEAWLAEAPISSHILLFCIGVLGVLSRPWIGTARFLVEWSLTAPRIVWGDDTEEK